MLRKPNPQPGKTRLRRHVCVSARGDPQPHAACGACAAFYATAIGLLHGLRPHTARVDLASVNNLDETAATYVVVGRVLICGPAIQANLEEQDPPLYEFAGT